MKLFSLRTLEIMVVTIMVVTVLIASFIALDFGLRETETTLGLVIGKEIKPSGSARFVRYQLYIENEGEELEAVVPMDFYNSVEDSVYVLVMRSYGWFSDKHYETFLPDLAGSYGVYPSEGQK